MSACELGGMTLADCRHQWLRVYHVHAPTAWIWLGGKFKMTPIQLQLMNIQSVT